MLKLKTLRFGNSGPDAELLQLALTRAGFDPGRTDGIFGSRTLTALKAFQRSRGLASDGIAGPETNAALAPYLLGYRVHTIKSGDTLYRLAERSGTTIRSILTANPGINPLNLQTGTKIKIPFGFPLVPENIRFTSTLMEAVAAGLTARYPFIQVSVIGKSVMGKPIYVFKTGSGARRIFYNGAHHANEWITATLLTKYLENYAVAYAFGGDIGGESAQELYAAASLYIAPLVNPDGADLVTGNLTSGSYYENAKKISENYPQFPFPDGWKANISGTDPNLQYPAGWENAREIKFSQGFVSPAPRDYVGPAPLSAPESRAVYEFTRRNDFALTLSYHTQGQVIYWRYLDYVPPCSREIGYALSDASGYSLETTPSQSGYAGYKDWFIYEYFRPGYTVEAGAGISPLPLEQFPEIYGDNVRLLSTAQILSC